MDDPQVATNHRAPCVVLISATPDDRFALTSASATLGFRLLCAHRFQQAADAIREEPVDIVICEQQMPDGDWKQLAWQTQNLRRRPAFIVIVDELSGQLFSDIHRSGGMGVLMRPLQFSKIDAAIRMVSPKTAMTAHA